MIVEDKDISLMNSIFAYMCEKGLKSMTMDSVAKFLGMSKRTLYEKFSSKEEMIVRVYEHYHTYHSKEIVDLWENSADMMHAFIGLISLHRKFLANTNVDFFRDMDQMFPKLKLRYKYCEEEALLFMMKIMHRGVRERVFRRDLNYRILLKLMFVQMESLKRMEELFPEGITLVEAYDTIMVSFLRSIATAKGMKLVDTYAIENFSFNQELLEDENNEN